MEFRRKSAPSSQKFLGCCGGLGFGGLGFRVGGLAFGSVLSGFGVQGLGPCNIVPSKRNEQGVGLSALQICLGTRRKTRNDWDHTTLSK